MYKNSNEKIKIIKEITRKNVSWQKAFIFLLEKEDIDLILLKKTFIKYKKYKNVLKNDITPLWARTLLHKDGTNRDVLEKFNDEVDDLLLKNSHNKFLKAINYKNHEYLFSKRVTDKIKSLLENKMPDAELKYFFLRNIKTITNEKKLYECLLKLEKEIINWNIENYINILNKKKLKFKVESYNVINIEINSFILCQEIGSKKWCISNNENDFDAYTSHFNKQFIVLDFNKKIEDKTSMMGVTINVNGKIIDAYYKDNSPVEDFNCIPYLFNKESIKNIKKVLNKYDNQVAFDYICAVGISDLFDEYIAKNKHKFPLSVFKKFTKISPSHRLNHAFRIAAKNGHIEILKKLIKTKDSNINPSSRNNYALRWSAEKGNTEIVKYLLTIKGVDPSADFSYSLRVAAENGYLEIVKMLINHPKTDTIASDHYALRWSIKNNHKEIVSVLMKDEKIKDTVNKEWVNNQIKKMK